MLRINLLYGKLYSYVCTRNIGVAKISSEMNRILILSGKKETETEFLENFKAGSLSDARALFPTWALFPTSRSLPTFVAASTVELSQQQLSPV